MPSGAKKRKAAKKKMQGNQSTNNPPNPHTHDGVKNNQDDNNKDTSDVGEVSHQKGEEGASVQIERELRTEGESIQKDGKSEPVNEGFSGSSSSDDSSSSSDDESHDVTSGPAVVDIAPAVDSVKPADLVSETPAEPVSAAIIEEANVLVETPVVDEIASLIEKPEVKDSEEKAESCLEDKVEIAADDVDAASKTEEETALQSVENIAVVSDSNECEVQQNDDTLTPISVPVHNGGETERDSVTQPLLEQPVQKTSWKGCCGLCELFSGSSR